MRDAYAAMIKAVGDPLFIEGREGSGENGARILNQGFVKTATELGFYIELTGDEFEVLGLAS